ncbi:MAG: SPFH domain-containing protein, partial [Clostridia bacterium]|nr:SPFH domain-containing protein [Clostridia bacterium]
MKEKLLTNKKHGMLVLLADILALCAALAAVILGGIMMDEGSSMPGGVIFGIGLAVLCLGWFPLIGLRVLKPQEALVLTLFGKYIGTIKGEGFYAVNPFCTSVNPAANTK